jgi:hypothetical protein
MTVGALASISISPAVKVGPNFGIFIGYLFDFATINAPPPAVTTSDHGVYAARGQTGRLAFPNSTFF